MGTPISYGLINPDGSPCTTASPIFLAFCVASTGAPAGEQAIRRFSGGQYEAQVSDTAEAAGTVWLIDNNPTADPAGPLPRYVYGSSCTPDNPILACCAFSVATGLPVGGLPPTIGGYTDRDDNTRPFPSVVPVPGFAYLYAVSPTLQDLIIGTSCRVDGATGTLPAYLNELFYNPDAVAPAGPLNTSVVSPTGVSIEDAIRAWVIAGALLDTSKVIFTMQTGGRPEGAFATVRLGGTKQLGAFDEVQFLSDTGRTAGTEVEQRVIGRRELPVLVQFFAAEVTGSATPNELATRAQLALSLPSLRAQLRAAGLVPYDVGEVVNISAIKGTKFEGRATLSVRFYVTRVISEFTGYIDTVNTRDFMGPPDEGTKDAIDI